MQALALLAAAATAAADDPQLNDPPAFDVSVSYAGDVVGALKGGLSHKTRYLDSGDLTVDADLGRLIGWSGAVVHVDGLYSGGGRPNDDIGTLQGVDNIEVADARVRLFEAWLDQSFNRASFRVGLYDLNSEFYMNDGASYLLAPAYGIGSEIAATGPNGPSIFPSTALSVRLNYDFGEGLFLRAAALNAHAGVLGDPGGVNTNFHDGGLVIVEGGLRAERTAAIGVWRYTARQNDIRAVDALGAPERRIAQGAYIVLEHPLNASDGVRAASLFARAGLSEGRTTDFKGGWQAGLAVHHVFEGREDSVFSFGANQGVVSTGYRLNAIDAGTAAARGEFQLEMTYADKILPHVTLQPDLQYVVNPAADRDIPDALVGIFRVSLEF